jgi:hypothetical protein
MAATKRGRAPTAEELRHIAGLRAAIAADVKAGRLHRESLEREAARQVQAARREALRRLLEPAPNPQRRLAG